jgi:inosine-uridine nucleoside N-ribohydrolase
MNASKPGCRTAKSRTPYALIGWTVLILSLFSFALPLLAQQRQKVIIDQDAMGPAYTDLQAILVLLQSPKVDPLGITVVSGDGWRDEEVAHTLRLLEIIGRPEIPVVPGAVFPLINTKDATARWEKLYGKITYQGAWNYGKVHEPFVVPDLPEGNPTLKPASEDAPHFIIRMLHQYPHEVTILTAGPLTNLGLAIAIDSQVPDLAKELVFNGARINPQNVDYKDSSMLARDFNLWWDPEAAHIVLRAPWHKITCTPLDISIKTWMSKDLIARIAKGSTPLSRYLARFATEGYMWDELTFAAWLDPTIITKQEVLYLDANINHGGNYGDTLSWLPGDNPGMGEQPIHVNEELDKQRFYDMFVELMTHPTPQATRP